MPHVIQHHMLRIVAAGAAVVVVAWTLWVMFGNRDPYEDLALPQREYVPEETRAPVPDNVRIPQEGENDLPAYVAVPDMTAPAGAHTAALIRSFLISANRNSFSPNTVIVRANDTVHMRIQAVDHAYNFVQPDYGFKVAVAQGETKEIEFHATAPGIFTFYCSTCNGENVEGKIVVTEK